MIRMHKCTFDFVQECSEMEYFDSLVDSISVSVIEPEEPHETYITIKTDRWSISVKELDSLGFKLKQLLTMARAHLPRESNGQS